MASKNKEAVDNSQKRDADGMPMTMMGSERRGGGAKKSKSEREDKRKTRGDREAPYRMEEKSVRKGKEGRRREANPAEGTQIIEGEHEAQEGLNQTERAGEGRK